MKRKTIQAADSVKTDLIDLKKGLKLKSESEAIAYLLQFHRMRSAAITLHEHERLLDHVRRQHDQDNQGGDKDA